MTASSKLANAYRGYRFPGAVIAHAVWLYLPFPLSYRDVEELLAERGIFRTLLGHTGGSPPERITTDKLGSYAAAKQRIPELEGVEHHQVRSRMRCNNRVEQAHQPTRIRERRMGRFRCPISAQRFLAAFARTWNLFRSRRRSFTASEYRLTLQDRFALWHIAAGLRA
jgi:putative transposase